MPDTIDIGSLVDAAAKRYGVPNDLAHTVVTMESQGNPNALSKSGAMGVMQLMPATASWLGVKDIWDPVQNINGGMKYLAQLTKRYNGDPKLVLAAYNAGPGAVDKHGGVPPFRETQNYVNTGVGMLRSRLLDSFPPAPPQAAPARQQAPAAPSGTLSAATLNPWEQQYAAPSPAAPVTAARDPWEQQYAAPPSEPSPLEKVGRAFSEGLGLPALADIGKGVWGEVTGDQPAIERGYRAAQNISQGLLGEPARIWNELGQGSQAMNTGDLPGIAYHLAGSFPLAGPAIQQIGQDIQSGDPASTVGHGGALAAQFLAPEVVPKALDAAGTVAVNAADAVSRAAEATEAGIRAGAPDVVKGAAKASGGAAVTAAIPLPPVGKMVVGAGLTRPGLSQMMRGIKTGVQAARDAVAARAAAEAAAQAARDAFSRGVAENVGRMTQPPPPALPPAESIQMPPAGTYAEEQRIQGLGPQVSEPTPAAPAPVAAPAAAPQITPGQAYAEAQGYDWAKLRPGDKALMENIARAHANVAAQPEPVPPVQATQPAPAQQPLTPQEIAQNLKAEMERSGTAPPPEAAPPQPTFGEAARAKKTDTLFDFITQKKIPMSWVEQFEDKEWKMLADAAGVKPPSETSIAQLKQRLADYEKAQSIPVNPAITPAELQTTFDQARATRTQPAK